MLHLNWQHAKDYYVRLTEEDCTLSFSNPKEGGRYRIIFEWDPTDTGILPIWPDNVAWYKGTLPRRLEREDVLLVYTNNIYYATVLLTYGVVLVAPGPENCSKPIVRRTCWARLVDAEELL